jgi:hypothetical protein
MNAPLTSNIRSMRDLSADDFTATTQSPLTDPHYAIGATFAHIDWAEAALRAGEPDRALTYLLRAKAELKAAAPTLEGHAERYFIAGIGS